MLSSAAHSALGNTRGNGGMRQSLASPESVAEGVAEGVDGGSPEKGGKMREVERWAKTVALHAKQPDAEVVSEEE